jgi:hypothetical protein
MKTLSFYTHIQNLEDPRQDYKIDYPLDDIMLSDCLHSVLVASTIPDFVDTGSLPRQGSIRGGRGLEPPTTGKRQCLMPCLTHVARKLRPAVAIADQRRRPPGWASLYT